LTESEEKRGRGDLRAVPGSSDEKGGQEDAIFYLRADGIFFRLACPKNPEQLRNSLSYMKCFYIFP
jgi:hypothetical protein